MLSILAGIIATSCILFSQPSPPAEITIDRLLVLPRAGVSGRSPVYTDAVEHAIVTGAWSQPAEGTTVRHPDGSELSWQWLEPGEDGGFRDRALAGGWALATVESDRERVMLLEARGHRSVYVNGEPRTGDVYDLGNTMVPILLRQGANELLFRTGRGSLRARLIEAPPTAMLEGRDPTLPDLIRGETADLPAGVIITNTTTSWLDGLIVTAAVGSGEPLTTHIDPIAPLASRKVAVMIRGEAPDTAEQATLTLTLAAGDAEPIDSREFTLRIRSPHDRHVRTFLSAIDGSVQYYAVTPPTEAMQAQAAGAGAAGDAGAAAPAAQPALILTLHGASVEATNQAAAYAPKPGTVIIAPTNRRPFGFDWEDWGRLDAIEVLDLASRRWNADPERTYLTGHSMGGHGTWIVGAMFAPRFAAIAPSAGWRDFWSYAAGPAREPDSDVTRLLHRAASASRTLLMEQNYAGLGVYILHGDADDNVPVSQARFMRERLGAFHTNFAYYEQPGAGHWWGDQCVDWPPMMEFFQRNRRPAAGQRRPIDFTTVDPGVSADAGWSRIEQQVVAREPSRVVAAARDDGAIEIATTNIARLAVMGPAAADGGSYTITIDSQDLSTSDTTAHLARDAAGQWSLADAVDPGHKRPERAGPFKDAFRHRMIFVIGTAGTPEEDAWALAKARYDAETLWYRGNGAINIITDAEYLRTLASPARHTAFPPAGHSNVILYGNRATNAAWDTLLADSPIVVDRGLITAGTRTIEGDDLACIFVRPHPLSDVASVGVVAGTGAAGARLTAQLPYFVSGAHYPDWTIIDSSMLTDPKGGVRGVVGCGFFASDWSLGTDHAWR